MENSSPTHVLVLFFLTICLSSFAATTARTIGTTNADSSTKLIHDSCSKPYIDQDFCVEILSADPRTKSASNIIELTGIAIQIAMKNSTFTKEYIEAKLNDHKSLLKPKETEVYQACLDAYKGLVGSFIGAGHALKVKDYEEASNLLVVASDDPKLCQATMGSDGVTDKTMSLGNFYAPKFTSTLFLLVDVFDN